MAAPKYHAPLGNRVIEVKPSERHQDGLPIMSFDFGCGAAEQHQLQRSRIVDVRREIEQALAGPPDAHRCAERIVLLKQEGPGAHERHDHLEEAAAE